MYKSWINGMLYGNLWGGDLFCMSSKTGHLRESSNETTATSPWLCLCAKKDGFPVHPEWLTSSATQQSSPLLSTASHNPPGQIHLNRTINIALIWRLFREKIKKNLSKGQYWMFFYGDTGPSTFYNKRSLVESFVIADCLQERNSFLIQNKTYRPRHQPAKVLHLHNHWGFLTLIKHLTLFWPDAF